MDWFERYSRIAFQLHAALEVAGDMYLVDTYYGPEAWRMTTPPDDIRQTLREIERLQATVPDIAESERRRTYLDAQLKALETVCRHLLGEPMTLTDTAQRFLDCTPVPVPDAVLEENRRMLEDALGGTGTLAERYARIHHQLLIQPTDDNHLLALYQRALAEARRRTRAMLPLPPNESVNISIVRDVFYGGANWYVGQGRSRMELNGSRPVTLLRLLLLACHEGYSGHHTESILKEQLLYQELGYTEQALFFNGPSAVISEGIATLAGGMIFPPDEAAAWLAAEYAAVGQPIVGVDLPLFMQAFWALDPDALSSNVLLLFEEGASEESMVAYALRYMLNTEAEVRRMVAHLQNGSFFQRIYSFTYYQGRALMEPLLQGDNRLEVWHTLLTEQTTPSLLRRWNQPDHK